MTKNNLETPSIREITFQEALALRALVLKPHLAPHECVNPGDLRPETFHYGYFRDLELVGIASFEKEAHPAIRGERLYRLRGMASSPQFRHQGIGRALVQAGEARLRSLGCEGLWFNARKAAFPFYRRLGYLEVGEIFEIDPIGPHKVMYKYFK